MTYHPLLVPMRMVQFKASALLSAQVEETDDLAGKHESTERMSMCLEV